MYSKLRAECLGANRRNTSPQLSENQHCLAFAHQVKSLNVSDWVDQHGGSLILIPSGPCNKKTTIIRRKDHQDSDSFTIVPKPKAIIEALSKGCIMGIRFPTGASLQQETKTIWRKAGQIAFEQPIAGNLALCGYQHVVTELLVAPFLSLNLDASLPTGQVVPTILVPGAGENFSKWWTPLGSPVKREPITQDAGHFRGFLGRRPWAPHQGRVHRHLRQHGAVDGVEGVGRHGTDHVRGVDVPGIPGRCEGTTFQSLVWQSKNVILCCGLMNRAKNSGNVQGPTWGNCHLHPTNQLQRPVGFRAFEWARVQRAKLQPVTLVDKRPKATFYVLLVLPAACRQEQSREPVLRLSFLERQLPPANFPAPVGNRRDNGIDP